jgi:hypothetical protein
LRANRNRQRLYRESGRVERWAAQVVAGFAVDGTDCEPVETASIEAGVTLVRWFAYEGRRIYTALAESDDAKQTRRLVEFIRSHGGRVTARDVHKGNKARYPDVEAAESAINELAEAGLAHWSDVTTGPKGGRPSRTLILKSDEPYHVPRNPITPKPPDGDDGGDATALTPEPPDSTPEPHASNGKPLESGGFGVKGLRGTGSKVSDEEEIGDLPPDAGPEVSGSQPKQGDGGSTDTHRLFPPGSGGSHLVDGR